MRIRHQERFLLLDRQAEGEVDGNKRLPRAALAADDGQDAGSRPQVAEDSLDGSDVGRGTDRRGRPSVAAG